MAEHYLVGQDEVNADHRPSLHDASQRFDPTRYNADLIAAGLEAVRGAASNGEELAALQSETNELLVRLQGEAHEPGVFSREDLAMLKLLPDLIQYANELDPSAHTGSDQELGATAVCGVVIGINGGYGNNLENVA